jgi:hypothetical protein
MGRIEESEKFDQADYASIMSEVRGFKELAGISL